MINTERLNSQAINIPSYINNASSLLDRGVGGWAVLHLGIGKTEVLEGVTHTLKDQVSSLGVLLDSVLLFDKQVVKLTRSGSG